MSETKKSSKRISPKKLSDLKVVVLCIAAATTFWILNALNKDDYNTIVDFPVEFVYNDSLYMPIGRIPNSVEVEISGNGWDLLRKYFNFNNDPYLIELDNPSARRFILTADIKRSLGEFLTPTQLVSVVNDSLKYQFDKIEVIQVRPILDSSSFSLATNYRIDGQVNFSPDVIRLKGPSSIIDSIGAFFPVKLDESRINTPFEKTIDLEVPSELADLVVLEDESLRVNFDVYAFLEGNKRLKIKKINFPRNVTFTDPDPLIMINYLLDERRVDDFKELEFEAVLDYYKRNKTDSTIAIEVQPQPNYMEQVTVNPPLLKLKYE
ncbi:YbbR-like domain-containing protein [Algoriphagus halophytocola]|uniref:YbbR-like domain-containing protein n=1 Tax=Algoriphagus halophytocola TaxID=2991499 RepID=A0ABY6MDR2_9BACT|nr:MULTISPECIES: YbbR-like domain-containing protein [unclassified Algoriphagus]UZD21912.1 YbbR-like domain-containing protein [Algoriphagus sp. TR-M5]WBL43162.1 YbbR-like domain-containing protein [Algoriphagus sp. TR-M9]